MTKANLLASAAVISLLLPITATAQNMSLVRIATMPSGAEVTGLSTNAGGELFLNAQHPGGKNTFRDDAPPATVGYVNGFDASKPSMSMPPEDQRDVVHTSSGSYVTFAKAGDTLANGQIFGGVYNTKGELMYVSNTPDFNGFIPTGEDTAFLYTGWEGSGRDGASGVSKLALKKVDGVWTSDLPSSKMLDLSSVHGGAVLCSGVVTPWGTPLMAEEYFFYNTSVWNHPDNHDEDERASFQKGNDVTYIKPKNMSQYLGTMSNPYRYGYMIEVTNPTDADGEKLVKHYATGRLSHETAAIMPDNKTLYMSDDDSAAYDDGKYNTASGGVFFKFIADTAGDLSAGTLYAAKLTQDNEADPDKAGFNVAWIELGHGNNAQIESWVAEYDSVQVADYVYGQSNYVTDDQIRAHAAGTAADARAAFLESRRTAAAMGATNEWDKLEGVTSQGNTVYVAVSALAFTMDKSWGHKDWSTGVIDTTVAGNIALNAEGCGGTYKSVTGDDYNITRLEPYVIGQTDAEGRCDANLPANPDNILVMNDGTLMIGEDAGSKKHELDMLWMVKN
jgi:secreted PhoX family phosphatase